MDLEKANKLSERIVDLTGKLVEEIDEQIAIFEKELDQLIKKGIE